MYMYASFSPCSYCITNLNMALTVTNYRFISPLPLDQCHPEWIENYNMYLRLEEEQCSSLNMLEELKAQYHRLKWSSNSSYIGAMKIRGVLSACRRLFAKRNNKLQEANELLLILCRHDSTTNLPFPPGTLVEEEEHLDSFEEWFGNL